MLQVPFSVSCIPSAAGLIGQVHAAHHEVSFYLELDGRISKLQSSNRVARSVGHAVICGVQAISSAAFVELLLAAARALCPVIRRFLSLGLNRVWLNAGQTAYQ